MKQYFQQLRVRLTLAYHALFRRTVFAITVEESKGRTKKHVTVLNYKAMDCLSDLTDAQVDIAERVGIPFEMQSAKIRKPSRVDVN